MHMHHPYCVYVYEHQLLSPQNFLHLSLQSLSQHSSP